MTINDSKPAITMETVYRTLGFHGSYLKLASNKQKSSCQDVCVFIDSSSCPPPPPLHRWSTRRANKGSNTVPRSFLQIIINLPPCILPSSPTFLTLLPPRSQVHLFPPSLPHFSSIFWLLSFTLGCCSHLFPV